jgi:phospholipase C
MNRLSALTLAGLFLTPPASAQINSFQHIIVVIRENRTPDNLFQGLCTTPSACSTRPGPGQYNIQTTGWLDNTSLTGTTNPTAVPLSVGYGLLHVHQAFVDMCDFNNVSGACAMDGAALVKCTAVFQPCPESGVRVC